MSVSNLKQLFEDYEHVSNSYEVNSVINLIIDEIFKNGFDVDSLNYFSKNFKKTQKQELIVKIFKEIEHAAKDRKYQIVNVLNSFLIETTPLIQDQILSPYFNIIAKEKKDFKLVFAALNIFTSRWGEFKDDFKKKVFQEFLKILDSPVDFFIEEGIFEITPIVLNSKSALDPTKKLFSEEEIYDFLIRLIKISNKSKGESLYAALESIKQVIESNIKLISRKTYDGLFPLFKRLLKKIAIFYPAKRKYIKICLSFVNLMLMFEEKFCDQDYVVNLRELIEKMASKIDHADIKYFLEVILFIVEKSKSLPKVEVIISTIDILRSFHNKSDRLDGYTSGLVKQIIDGIWPLLSDEEKDLFFQETEFGKSVV